MRYKVTTYVEAVQFSKGMKDLPPNVRSDGKGDAATDSRYSYVLNTADGAVYLNEGDYVITGDDSSYKVPADVFEKIYEKAE